jgi:hypothetical protein
MDVANVQATPSPGIRRSMGGLLGQTATDFPPVA